MQRASNGKIAFLAALSLFLASLEMLLPRPVPFFRVGLSNFPLLLALGFPLKSYALLALLKCAASALISGTVFSYIFVMSLAGTIASAAVMFLLHRVLRKHSGLIGISAAGAFISNCAQLAVAYYCFLGRAALFIAPPLLITGIVSGAVLGVFAAVFTKESKCYVLFTSDYEPSVKIQERRKFRFKIKPLYIIIGFLSIVFFNLLTPYGKVLCKIGSFAVTSGALLDGFKKAACFEGAVIVSKLLLALNIKIPGSLGRLLDATFAFFAVLGSKKERVTKGNKKKGLIAALDEALLRAFCAASCGDVPKN